MALINRTKCKSSFDRSAVKTANVNPKGSANLDHQRVSVRDILVNHYRKGK